MLQCVYGGPNNGSSSVLLPGIEGGSHPLLGVVPTSLENQCDHPSLVC